MLPRSLNREFAFSLNDVARMLRTYADQKASQFGITRAQWVVLVRLDRFEGLKQSELAEMLDLQPITLTRLLDRLCESGLIERRADPNDRRAKRLYLTAAGPAPAGTPWRSRRGIDGHRACRRRSREPSSGWSPSLPSSRKTSATPSRTRPLPTRPESGAMAERALQSVPAGPGRSTGRARERRRRCRRPPVRYRARPHPATKKCAQARPPRRHSLRPVCRCCRSF